MINLTLHCWFHVHFVHGQKKKERKEKKRSQDILLTIVQPERMSDSCTLSRPLYRSFFFFLSLLSKQWSFIHYSAIRDLSGFFWLWNLGVLTFL
jgi:hypothetical protein